MACRFTYNGKVYDEEGLAEALRDMPPVEAARFIPGIKPTPEAPFVGRTNDWASLAMKRMIRWAAENGYDQVAWTTGKTQAGRYNMRQAVDSIEVALPGPGSSADRAVNIKTKVQGTIGVQVDRDGKITEVKDEIPGGDWTGKSLSDVVGKELADKIMAAPMERPPGLSAEQRKELGRERTRLSDEIEEIGYFNTDEKRARGAQLQSQIDDINYRLSGESRPLVYEGEGLEVGGEGHKGFYDQILPTTVNKLVKKYGGKVERGEIPDTSKKIDRDQIAPDAQATADHQAEWDRLVAQVRPLQENRDYSSPEYKRLTEEQDALHAKMVNETITRIPEPTLPVHVLPLTDKLKESALSEGFPMFQGGRRQPLGSFQPVSEEQRAAGMRPMMHFNPGLLNASTPGHEFAHQFLFELARAADRPDAPQWLKDDYVASIKWMGLAKAEDLFATAANGRDFTPEATAAHEKFARGHEAWQMEGRAPHPALARIFAIFARWLRAIYGGLQGLEERAGMKLDLSPRMREVYAHLYTPPDEVKWTTIGPDEQASLGHADVHEADARNVQPEQADAGETRIAAEADRRYRDATNDTRNRLGAADAAAQRADAGRTDGGPSGQPGGPAGAGAGASPAVESRGSVTDAGAARGGAGAGTGTVGEGAAGAASEGGGLAGGGRSAGGPAGGSAGAGGAGAGAGVDSRAGLDEHPLAPSGPHASPRRREFTDKAGNIRLDNIPDNIDNLNVYKDYLRNVAEENSNFLLMRGGGVSTNGVVTPGMIYDLAVQLDLTVEDLERRKVGQTFNAQEITATQLLLVQSLDRVKELENKALQSKSLADLVAYVEAKEQHVVIQGHYAGITADTARAFNALKKSKRIWTPERLNSAPSAEIEKMLKEATGQRLYQLQLQARYSATLDTAAKQNRFLREADRRSIGGMLTELWLNNLISGVATHMTYVTGNQLTKFIEAVPETVVASAIGAARRAMGRPGERVYAGEALEQIKSGALFGIGRDWTKAAQASLEGLRTGMPTNLPGQTTRPLMPFFGDTALNIAKTIQNDPVTFHELAGDFFGVVRGIRDGVQAAAEAVTGLGGQPGAPLASWNYSPLGQIPDIAVKGVPVIPIGSAIRLPGRMVSGIHSFDTASNYYRNTAALAYREGMEMQRAGTLTAQQFAQHTAWRRAHPTDEMMENAREKAYAATVMGPGGEFIRRISALSNYETRLPGIGAIRPMKFIMPFVHIGANVIEQAVMRRTPLGILSETIRNDLTGKNGNIAQDYAMARMAVGTALAVGYGTLAMEGYITGSGPTDPHQAATWREVYQPHSVRIGDFWYQVNRLGPMGIHLGIAADMYDVARDASDGDMLTAGTHLWHAITQNIFDESFLRGPAELFKAVEDPGRYGERYLMGVMGGFVPFSVGQYQMNRAMDPYTRQARTVMDAINQRILTRSTLLEPRISAVDGEPLPSPDAFIHRGFTSVWMKRVNTDPVRRALLELGVSPAPVDRSIRNVDLTDDEYTQFAELAGRLAKARADTIVRSPAWQQLQPMQRHDVLVNVYKQSKEIARGQMMRQYPHIPRDAVNAKRDRLTDEPEAIR